MRKQMGYLDVEVNGEYRGFLEIKIGGKWHLYDQPEIVNLEVLMYEARASESVRGTVSLRIEEDLTNPSEMGAFIIQSQKIPEKIVRPINEIGMTNILKFAKICKVDMKLGKIFDVELTSEESLQEVKKLYPLIEEVRLVVWLQS